MEEKKWPDLSQYEYPESAGVVSQTDMVKVFHDRLITKINLLAWNAQFLAELEVSVGEIEENISTLNIRKHHLINWHVTHSFTKIPVYYRRRKDLLISWIEENLIKGDLATIDEKIEKQTIKLMEERKKLFTHKYKYEVLKKSIDVGICIVNSMARYE